MNPKLKKLLSRRSILWKILPLIVLILGGAAAFVMVKNRPHTERRSPRPMTPLVRVMEVSGKEHRYSVKAQGTVVPRTESALVSEVRGEVIWISPSYGAGSFFEKDEMLLQIDPTDYEAAVTQAAATVASAKVQLALEEEETQVAREEYSDLAEGEASPLALREPQLQQAHAQLEAAQANLARTRRDLERTEIRAPYAGRIRMKNVDLGQYVNAGTILATIFAVDRAEVRLPMTMADLTYLDIPLGYAASIQAQKNPQQMPAVLLSAKIGSHRIEWEGRIVRVEGEIDPKSRMIHVVAGVDDPYGRKTSQNMVPLTAGLFVDAEIFGRRVDHVYLLPRSVLRNENTLLVIDDENHLHIREVSVLRKGRQNIVVGEGLSDGERVCLSPLDTVTEGMKVRVYGASDDSGEVPTGEVLQ